MQFHRRGAKGAEEMQLEKTFAKTLRSLCLCGLKKRC